MTITYKVLVAVGLAALCAMGVPALSLADALAIDAESPGPRTQDIRRYDIYVADQETYDSNLYRLPTSSIVAANFPNTNGGQDHYNSASLGTRGLWTSGLQQIIYHARVDENRFSRNTTLNSSTGLGDLTWNWQFGPHFSGQVGGFYRRALASFAETRFLGHDLLATTAVFGLGRYQVGPRWAIYGGFNNSTNKHSAAAIQYDNSHGRTASAGIEYATDVNNTIGWEYAYADRRYSNLILFDGAQFDRSFRETTNQLVVKYALSDKTSVEAHAGYLNHYYPSSPVGAFSGDIWRVSLHWLATEKIQVVADGWRELRATLFAQSDHFLAKGVSLTPVWKPSGKIKFSFALASDNQNFIGLDSSVLTFAVRSDKVRSQQLNLQYQATTALVLEVSYRDEQRTSNQALFQFDDRLAKAWLTFTF